MDEIVATLQAMRSQESAYQTRHYLRESTNYFDHVDIECRTKMTGWCYQVVDFCKFDKETASIATNYLDRFLASDTGSVALLDRNVYQLAAMTCLYTSVKIHEPEAMSPDLLSKLSHGAHSPEEIEKMEASILTALQWRLNPPTSLAFARTLLSLIPDMDSSTYDMIYAVVRLQTELAAKDYSFINTRASTIGFCSLMNAIESLGMDNKVLATTLYHLGQALGMDLSADSVAFVQESLYKAVEQAEDPKLSEVPRPAPSRKTSRRASAEISPQSVAALR